MTTFISNENHYILLSISPPTHDILTLRKTISNALSESFGLTFASTYLDILWVEELGDESRSVYGEGGGKCVVRLHKK
jgi:hypothetical protein